MDEDSNAMFPGIISSIGQIGPKSTNLVAEPAQVMVLVPGTRAKEAENSLASLKMYIYIFVFFIFVVLLGIGFYYYKKRPKYEGRELPGAYEKPITKVAFKAPPKETTEVLYTKIYEEPLNPTMITYDDIVDVVGEIPVWSINDDVAPIENDEKVSENSADSILNL